ncbi:PREDICTED: transcription factor GTE5, chloroplastic-like isoform X2 [Tarenaya hassleriana]|uniref:transcription factor GTE5, chloroplastic-like isoform X2 n=1 Tax=Tarenaya hassleriana TaxID=28532 RepID=UPI00053C740F|nr:PREDICTED: transcription factor GTE5, chloroplastic-like isoform X2 [Tarenaya hassleriana]
MASGPLQGVGASKPKHRWTASGNKSQSRPKPAMASRQERPVPPVSPTNSIASEDDHHMVNISLNSISKLEVRNLKRKLKAELDEVRSLIKRLEPRENVSGGLGDMPRADAKKMKAGNGGKKGGFGTDKGMVQILKNCNNLLTKLMKHKFGWVFNAPVDVKGLGLHDYHTVVKKPMDLGTVKTRLGKNWYKSPLEFAEDVRLTFNNAMLYNPKGHEVHHMAEHLLKMLEEKWVSIESQYDILNRSRKPTRGFEFPVPVSTNTPVVDPLPAPTPSPSPPRVVENWTLERAESMTTPVEHETVTMVSEKPEEEQQDREEEEREEEDDEEAPGTRDLTFEEKRRLSEDLQDLPFDRLETVVQIIKKRNPELSQQDDEIELDIDSVDLETLWELHRFVTEYKESLNKKKEDHGFGSERDAESVHNINQELSVVATGTGTSRVTESGRATPPTRSPVQRENNLSGSSSSNSSSSDSGSCSSDSDSDSSSGHGSDKG